MKITAGRVVGTVFSLAALAAAAIFIAPEIEATAWREPLHAALRDALGRNVVLGDVRYQLWPAPGLSAMNLVIPDEPAFGLEPLAYMTEMQVSVRLWSLLTGRLEISSVRLVEASVNLARNDELGWNFARLLEQMMAGVRRAGRPPGVELRNGRINFRSGLVKSPFFLNNVDLDLTPPASADQPLVWSYEASPARTDRSEQGFGNFTGEGRWDPRRGPAGALELQTELENSSLGEVVTLLAGQDLGLQGRISSRVRFDGPLQQIHIQGRIDLEDVERSTLLSFQRNTFRVPFEGTADLPLQTVEINTAPPAEGPPLLFSIRFTAETVLLDPHWRIGFSFDSLPAPVLLALARRVGARVPADLEVTGQLSGSLTLARGSTTEGRLDLKDASVRVGNAGPVTLADAPLIFSDGRLQLDPAEVRTPSGAVATLSGEWSYTAQSLLFDLKFPLLPWEELRDAASALPDVSALPVLSSCRQGALAGSLRFESPAENGTAPWSGDLAAANLRCSVEGFADPLLVTHASLSLRGGQWSLRRVAARWGRIALEGSATWHPDAARPLHFTASTPELTAQALSSLLAPSLARRRSLLDRTLPFRKTTTPEWLSARAVEGDIRAARFTIAGLEFTGLTGRAQWDGVALEVPALTAHLDDATFSGRLSAALGGDAPAWRVTGHLGSYTWNDLTMDSDLELSATGLGSGALDSLHAEGKFQLRGLEIPGESWHTVSGAFDYAPRRSPARIRFRALEAQASGESLTGSGSLSADNKLSFEFASPRRVLHLAGALTPFVLEAVPASRAR
jgi:hypothetical protein